MIRLLKSSVLTLLLSLLCVCLVVAQNTCALLVEEALTAVDENCEGIARNEACYGFDRVRASFVNPVPEDFFTQPTDVTGLLDLETIATSALDEAAGTWGVAVMNVQANLPDTLPGQNVTFVLLGDTEVENAIAPEEVSIGNEPVQVVSADFVTVRSGPGDTFNSLAGFAQGSHFVADAFSPDGQWVRVLVDERVGWVLRSRLVQDVALERLAAQNTTRHTPMQAVYLRTGIGQPTCTAAPDDMLLIQGPEGDIEIELTINGANIRVGSTVAVRLLREDVMEFFVIDGTLELLDENGAPTGLILHAGQRSTSCLSEPDSRGLDGENNDRIVACEFSPPQWVASNIISTDWCVLQNIPDGLLNYPVDLLCPGELLPTPLPPPTHTPTPVVPRPVLVVTDEPQVPQTTTVDCSAFTLSWSPNPIIEGPTTFQWQGATGSDFVEVFFFNEAGDFAGSIQGSAPQGNSTVNMGTIPTGSNGSIVAWASRQTGATADQREPLCTLGPFQFQRVAGPYGGPQPPTPTDTPIPAPPVVPPDLTVAIISSPTPVACSGSPVTCTATVTFTVTNQSRTNIVSGFSVLIEADQVPSNSISIAGLAAGATTTITVDLGPGGNCYDPDCTVRVTVDSNSDITEGNEGNNIAVQTDFG